VLRKPEKEQEKKWEKRYHHSSIQQQSLLVVGVLGGGCAPGGQGLLVAGVRARGWRPLLFYSSGACLIASWKFSKMSQWIWDWCVLVVSHSSPKGKCSTSLPMWHQQVSWANTLPLQGFTRYSTLPYQGNEVPKAQCLISGVCLIQASLSVSLKTDVWGNCPVGPRYVCDNCPPQPGAVHSLPGSIHGQVERGFE